MVPLRFSIPPSYCLVRKGRTLLLLREDFREMLVAKGICEFERFLVDHARSCRYRGGRIPHPTLSLSEGVQVVARRYTHGGLLRSVTRDLFLFGARSFQELALTQAIRSQGIPTLEPIAAVHQKTFPPFYRAFLLSLEIPEACNLLQYLQKAQNDSKESLLSKRRVFRSIGHLLRRLHDAGFFHADLQIKNILIVNEEPLLIDFDRSYRRPILSVKARLRNLLRLHRSMEKWKRMTGLRLSRTDQWRIFSAYAQEDSALIEAVRNRLRHHRLRLLRYRLWWTLDRLLHGTGSSIRNERRP